MNSFSYYPKKDFHFSLRPSAKELTEIDVLCFISSWTEQDYNEMQKVPFFNSWLLGGIIIFVMGALLIQFIASKIRQTSQKEEGLQPWDDPDSWDDDYDRRR